MTHVAPASTTTSSPSRNGKNASDAAAEPASVSPASFALIDAIRADKPYNEVERGAIASMVASMGRMAAHTGQIITFEQILNCPHEFAPEVDKLALNGPAPVRLGPDGKYPVPEPGIKKDREY